MPYACDVAVIGSGPTGLFTVFEAGMLGLKCAVIEALEEPGGQCAALYPQKPIYDIPGFPKIAAGDLVKNLQKQAAPFNPRYYLRRQAMTLEHIGAVKRITTDKNDVIDAKAVIIAAGAGAFAPNRPPLEGLAEYEGKSVFYAVTDAEKFAGKNVVIAGGGDSAADWAIALAENGANISLVHRRAEFRCAEDSARKLRELCESGAITLCAPYQLAALLGEGGALAAVVIKNLKGDVSRELPADYLLPFFGLAMRLGPLEHWGVNTDKKHFAVDPATMNAGLPGVFAVGDVASYPGKLKLILTGFAEAALAAHSARAHIFPDKNFHFEYSTGVGVPA